MNQPRIEIRYFVVQNDNNGLVSLPFFSRSSVNLVAIRGTDFSQQVSLTTSREASASEQLINQRQKCPDTVVFYWAAWIFFASNGQRGRSLLALACLAPFE